MEPIALEKFSNYVLEMHKDRDFGFETEYAVSSIGVAVVSLFMCCTVCLDHQRSAVVHL